jgi:hypothetical protein
MLVHYGDTEQYKLFRIWILAQLRFLGIEQGKPFKPDARQKKILEDAAPSREKAWFAYFPFYGPTEQFFDKSWVLPDIEVVK